MRAWRGHEKDLDALLVSVEDKVVAWLNEHGGPVNDDIRRQIGWQFIVGMGWNRLQPEEAPRLEIVSRRDVEPSVQGELFDRPEVVRWT
jgi:hypothetical protein